MAAKEKKIILVRQLTKESLDENDKSVLPEPTPKNQKRGRRTNTDKAKQTPGTPIKRGRRDRKKDMALVTTAPVTPEEGKQAPQKSRKTFLEKELEDILENATGRNTPLEERAGVFLAKARREPEDDTLSVRSLSTFSRTRRGGEIDDDLLSLRSLKVRNIDDDTMSVRSLPSRKAAKKTVPAAPKVRSSRTKKPTAKKKAQKTKDTKKKPIRLQTKIGPKQRSTMIAKKKVKKAVKRIYKRKAPLKENATAVVESVVKEPTVPAKGSETEVNKGVVVAETNGGNTVEPKKRRRLIREPPVITNGTMRRKRGRWESEITFGTTRSSDDSSVIIVHPRLGPKARKIAPEPEAVTPTEVNHTPASETVATTNGSSNSSTPYFIQTVSNFNALKSQPTAQGDWLVTPSGVVLIQVLSTYFPIMNSFILTLCHIGRTT